MSDLATSTSTMTSCGPLGHKITVERTVVKIHTDYECKDAVVIRRPPPRCHLVWPPLVEFELDIEGENPLRMFLFELP